jgi:phosphoribosyl-ATP pyrophosphohydrolase/phosphoribosyl-AMP cyclohydrolase/histidinol dehydrogenase
MLISTVQVLHGSEPPLASLLEEYSLVGEVLLLASASVLEARSSELTALLGARAIQLGKQTTAEAARRWLDAGVRGVRICREIPLEELKHLPKERLLLTCEADNLTFTLANYKELIGAVVVPFGSPMDAAKAQALVKQVSPLRLVLEGDARTSLAEVIVADAAGAHVILPRHLLPPAVPLSTSFGALVKSDRQDGLWVTMVVDEHGTGLGVCYSNQESLTEAMRVRRGVYWSRSRGLWRKGESSGAWQQLLAVDLDCDRDTLRFVVKQHGAGFCHENTRTCFGEDWALAKLMRTIESRRDSAPAGSYTRRLFEDPKLLASKVLEEAHELVEAKTKEDIAAEAADVMYFALTYCAKAGVSLHDIERELERRTLKVTRRPGNAKPAREQQAAEETARLRAGQDLVAAEKPPAP